MSRKNENVGFVCEHCGTEVAPLENGSYRNHCPFCLHSKHVDMHPGDRANPCRGIMEPRGLKYHSKKGWQIVHRCLKCREERFNVAAEYGNQPDQIDLLAGMVC